MNLALYEGHHDQRPDHAPMWTGPLDQFARDNGMRDDELAPLRTEGRQVFGGGAAAETTAFAAPMQRRYVTMKHHDDQGPASATGLVYGEIDSPYLQDCLNIEEVNLPDGRWLLVIGNQQRVSDDLAALEADLMAFAVDEGYVGAPCTFPPLPDGATPEDLTNQED